MSRADFEAALKDPAVQETLEKWKAAYDVAKIQGVPAYVVNGKYLIYTKTSNPSILWLNSFGNWPLKISRETIMDFIKGLWRDLRARPVDTLVRWQEQRFLWLLMAIAMGGLIIWRTRSSKSTSTWHRASSVFTSVTRCL